MASLVENTKELFVHHFTPQNNLGPAENMFVHEFAHLRWGLFDEYTSSQRTLADNERCYDKTLIVDDSIDNRPESSLMSTLLVSNNLQVFKK